MNTQVKVGIAAAIVAALVALIVLDQKTSPKDDAAQRSSPGGEENSSARTLFGRFAIATVRTRARSVSAGRLRSLLTASFPAAVTWPFSAEDSAKSLSRNAYPS